MSRPRARRLVVLLCFGFGGVHLAALIAVRATETERELEGVTGPPEALIAYSASIAHYERMEFADAIAAAETACALAPGTPIGIQAAKHESILLSAVGWPELAARVVERELGQRPWPPGESTRRLARAGMMWYQRLGLAEEERRLAERAIEELVPAGRSYFHQRLTVLLQEAGDAEAAHEQFELALKRRGPPYRIHREAALAAAQAMRELGNEEGAAEFEAYVEEEAEADLPSFSRHLRFSGATRDNPVATGIGAELVGERQARVHWWSVANADLEVVATWATVSLVLLLLALFPVERFASSPGRQLAGGLALCAVPGLTGYVSASTVGMGALFLVAPLANAHVALAWSAVLLAWVLFGIGLGLTVIEGQSLRALGWRSGRRLWLYVILSLLAATIFVSGGISHIVSYAGKTDIWAPPLAVTCALASLMAAFTEETLFRGYLLNALARIQPRFIVANIAQALLFTGLHVLRHARLPADPRLNLGGKALWWLAFSLLTGWVTRRTGSLWPAFVIHFVFDLVAVYALALPEYQLLRVGAGLM